MRAVEYEILRDLKATGRESVPLDREPVRVATLIDEAEFKRLNGQMIHHKTVFFEDKTHDWDWRNGRFRYYTPRCRAS